MTELLRKLMTVLNSLSGSLRGALSITLLLFVLDTGLVAYALSQLSSVVQS